MRILDNENVTIIYSELDSHIYTNFKDFNKHKRTTKQQIATTRKCLTILTKTLDSAIGIERVLAALPAA